MKKLNDILIFNKILKDCIIVRFPDSDFRSTAVITLKNYYNSIGGYKEEILLERTKALISENTNNIYYICPLKYKEMMINNPSITEVIIKHKFKDNTLNKAVKKINNETRKI